LSAGDLVNSIPTSLGNFDCEASFVGTDNLNVFLANIRACLVEPVDEGANLLAGDLILRLLGDLSFGAPDRLAIDGGGTVMSEAPETHVPGP
jgi:hypothetical protein